MSKLTYYLFMIENEGRAYAAANWVRKKFMHTGPNDHENVSQIYFFLHKIEIRFKDVKSHSSSFNDNIAWLSFPTALIAYTLIVKVRKSQKQIYLFSYLPKNERNVFALVDRAEFGKYFVRFLEEFETK